MVDGGEVSFLVEIIVKGGFLRCCEIGEEGKEGRFLIVRKFLNTNLSEVTMKRGRFLM